jgi:hypothetical protein
MNGDEDLREAINQGAALALVRVRSVESTKAGTRSRTAVYDVAVEGRLTGELPSPVTLKHFGLPLLAVGQLYAIGAVDSKRHHDAWELRFATLAVEADIPAALSAFRQRKDRVDSAR